MAPAILHQLTIPPPPQASLAGLPLASGHVTSRAISAVPLGFIFMDMTPDHRGCLLHLGFPRKALPGTRTRLRHAVFESWYLESGVRAWGKGRHRGGNPPTEGFCCGLCHKHGGHQWYLLEASELPPAGLFTCWGGSRASPPPVSQAASRMAESCPWGINSRKSSGYAGTWHPQGAGRCPRAESRKTLAWGPPYGESLGPPAGLSSCPLLPHLPVKQGELLTSPTYQHRFQEKPALPRLSRRSLCEQPRLSVQISVPGGFSEQVHGK